ncbi:MAG TPA: hypothetical protein VGI86_10575, partial [Acidimicrobiia bacterium]
MSAPFTTPTSADTTPTTESQPPGVRDGGPADAAFVEAATAAMPAGYTFTASGISVASTGERAESVIFHNSVGSVIDVFQQRPIGPQTVEQFLRREAGSKAEFDADGMATSRDQ